MKKLALCLLTFSMIMSCKNNQQEEKKEITVNYPETKKVDTVSNYFGTEIKDPYRWLEDDKSAETGEWVAQQNEATYGYLDNIPYREDLKNRLEKLWNYEKVGAPFKKGENTYFYKNNGIQNHYVVYKKEGDNEEVFLDPNTFSEDGTTSLAGLSFTEDGTLAAYSISEGGSDWRKVIVIKTETKEVIEDTLQDVKFSGVSWKGNDGFYYSSYDKPKGSELSAKTDQHKVYYHKLGTPQKEDVIVYGATPEEKHRYITASVTKDQKYVLLSAAISTSGNKLFIKDLSKLDAPLTPIINNTDSDTRLVENVGSKLYLYTNLNAPNGKIVTVDASNPAVENWKDFIPETENVLSISKGGNNFFAEYMVDAVSKVSQYDYDGKLIREVNLPGIGTV